MKLRRFLILSIVVAVAPAIGRPAAQDRSVVAMLDRYAAGQFDAVVAELHGEIDFDAVLEQLEQGGQSWIDAAGAGHVRRRRLVAATFALEAARAGAWRDWKRTQRQPRMCADLPPDLPPGFGARPPECYQPPSVLHWKAPPLILEWACGLMRRDETPEPVERWFQLAALAVAQRSEDVQFLIGDPYIGVGVGTAEIANTQDEIKHLEHATTRFPGEMRFLLAQGIARERAWPEEAVTAYEALEHDPDVGGEATMRLGALQLRQRNLSNAFESFDRAEEITRDPYVIFLARYFRGQAHERQRDVDDAEEAYRGAVAAVPHAQSATIALAALVFRDGRRAEAQQLIHQMLAADPRPRDPWRRFVHADDRFWPQLVARLRWELQQ
jgi:hypothetical protein